MCFLCFQGAEGVAGFGDAAHQGQSSQKIKWGAEEEAVGGSCCSWEPQGERDGIIPSLVLLIHGRLGVSCQNQLICKMQKLFLWVPFFLRLWFNYSNFNGSAFMLEAQVMAAALELISLANKQCGKFCVVSDRWHLSPSSEIVGCFSFQSHRGAGSRSRARELFCVRAL